MSTSKQDIQVNVLTSELLDSMVGRRVVIGGSSVPILRHAHGMKGRIVGWKHDTIVRSEVLFRIDLDTGRSIAAGFYELYFPIQDADTAEDSSHA